MIIEITNNNLQVLANSFISKEMVKSELSNNPFAHFLILKENKEIIGYLYYSDIYDRAEINQFEVNLIHRNCGKGKILLDYLIHVVDKSITLEVKIDNIPAISIYKKFGFKKVAIRKNYYNGTDGLLMERKNKTL